MNKYGFVAVMLSAILFVSVIFTTVYVKSQSEDEGQEETVIVTSFYPMYIAALNVVGDVDGIQLENLSEPQTGCLHDFQLTPEDMKLLSKADVFIVNGGGIENFMTEVAAAYPKLAIIYATEGLELLMEDEEANAHAWMSIACYRKMVEQLAASLAETDPENKEQYLSNAAAYESRLEALQTQQEELLGRLSGAKAILFHEAFAYVAEDFGMAEVFAMDLDEERQVSAGEIASVIRAIDEDGAQLILAEELYGSDTAETIQAERDIAVIYLDPLTRGEYDPDSYLKGMQQNLDRLREEAP